MKSSNLGYNLFMKLFTKKLLAVLAMFVACSTLHAAEQDILFSRKWSLAILDHSALRLDEFTAGKPYLEFQKDNTFAAFVGCNKISGSYILTPPNGLTFTVDMASVNNQSSCSEKFITIENKFISILALVKSWSISGIDGPVLNFHNQPDNVIVIFAGVQVH
jgi:heat shock protein HslJ